jgi:hypothetical protein
VIDRALRMPGALRDAGRALRLRGRGEPGGDWRWVSPPELEDGIAIADLVVPLRYDVLVRLEFIRWYRERREQAERERPAFLAAARETSYHRWWMTAETIRGRPWLLGRTDELDALFERRVEATIRLAREAVGDPSSVREPIVLKTGRRLLPPTTLRGGPATAKRVSDRFFLADGCHRLALLIAAGRDRLVAGQFRVKEYETFSPFDATTVLARELPIASNEYVSFLASRYAPGTDVSDPAELVRRVAATDPDRADDVLAALQADGLLEPASSAS